MGAFGGKLTGPIPGYNESMRETARALAAYAAYAAYGPTRSLAKLARETAHSRKQLEHWSAAHGWQRRVAEHDAGEAAQVAGVHRVRAQQRVAVEEAAEDRRAAERQAMLDRHAAVGRDLLDRAVTALQRCADDQGLDAAAAVRLLREAAAIERAARGVADAQSVTVAGTMDLVALHAMLAEVDGEQAEWERERGYRSRPVAG